MKKQNIFILVLILILSTTTFAGLFKKKVNENELKVGATPIPHAEILEFIKKDLAKEGIKLKIVEFTDYVTPNLALNDGEIDANFFQHIPYMNKFSKERNLKLVSVGTVHVEPMGLFSKKIQNISELKNGSIIAIPNDPSNGGRALILLEDKGLIKLKDDAGLNATEFDIIKNPKKLKFKALEAAQLPRVLQDVDAAVINGNYALESNLNPAKDALLVEGANSPYANIVTVVAGNEKNKKIQKLIKVLQSEKVKKFIKEKYNGAIIPAF
ncbi:D-methionine transport system substrate-binding protein [Hypnocyclicus thermotrophus]|uniref:Lipoprotein n=1 Tax=Hypnocyclicus thermotrophus TaxID=1627895 RepID=A0AA46E0I6_9FUSO|nr:MetQ/NlpA family ABC transporter substrate-binding protein [Hypnocyclicus thermotrophus]TDT72516.1 D-methionine transport system substrate-binding protein [Hypnocyclicus thermotrophus]